MVESTKNKAVANDEVNEVDVATFGKIKQKASPFLNQKKSWDDDEDFQITPELKKGIIDELCFSRPSHIQAVAIPLMIKTDSEGNYQNLIAQSKNGSGKTGAFTIGSTLRIDPKIPKTQVLVIAHIRELVS